MQQMINLREANQNLSKYISSLQEGDEIVITIHGKAVAKLVSVAASHGKRTRGLVVPRRRQGNSLFRSAR